MQISLVSLNYTLSDVQYKKIIFGFSKFYFDHNLKVHMMLNKSNAKAMLDNM